jgi:hypothetical protein
MSEAETTPDSSPGLPDSEAGKAPRSKRKSLPILGLAAGLAALAAVTVILWVTNGKENAPTSQIETADQDSGTKITCGADENEKAGKGVFCSEAIGVKLRVPDLFKGKLARGENYDLYDKDGAAVGQSELVFEATVKDPADSDMANTYRLIIARTPLVSRQGPCFDPCEFDSKTRTLYAGETGKEAESVTVDGIKFFKGVIGDGGDYIVTYMGVVGDKVIEITLISGTYLGPGEEKHSVNQEKLFIDFDKLVKTLRALD